MRKFLTIIVYTVLILLIGRNMSFLPRFSLFSDETNSQSRYAEKVKPLIEEAFTDFNGNYSVYFADLASSDAVGIDEKETYTAASVNKVPIIASLYFLDGRGKANLDEQVTIQKVDIQDYGTGSLRYKKPGGIYSLQSLAKLALKESDNTAAHIISQKIGTDVLQNTVTQFGLTQTHMEENKTSVYDMYLLFKRIYNNELASPGRSQELLSFLKDTNLEDRLSKDLPSDTVMYHKTGDGQGVLHDVGIIERGENAYFLGVFTSDIAGKESDVKKRMALLAKKIDTLIRDEQ